VIGPLAAPGAGLLRSAADATALALGLDRLDRLDRGPLQRDPDIGRVQLEHHRISEQTGALRAA
jgi:hypothetical protein